METETPAQMPGDDGIFERQPLQDTVSIQARFLNRNIHKSIENALRNTVEGTCSRHGFVRRGSVQIRTIGMGKVVAEPGGSVTFPIEFSADVCNPSKGSVVRCTIQATNSYAIYATNQGDPVLEIIVPATPRSFEHAVSPATLKVGQEVRVRIIGKKFDLGQDTIVCVGQLVDSAEPVSISTEGPVQKTGPVADDARRDTNDEKLADGDSRSLSEHESTEQAELDDDSVDEGDTGRVADKGDAVDEPNDEENANADDYDDLDDLDNSDNNEVDEDEREDSGEPDDEESNHA